MQLSPENSEEFVEYLKSIGRLDDAAVKLAEIVNRVSYLYIICTRLSAYMYMLVNPNA